MSWPCKLALIEELGSFEGNKALETGGKSGNKNPKAGLPGITKAGYIPKKWTQGEVGWGLQQPETVENNRRWNRMDFKFPSNPNFSGIRGGSRRTRQSPSPSC